MFLEWITLQRSKNLRVSRKYAEEKAASIGQMSDFRASEGWLEKFMSRNGLLLRRRMTQSQETPEQIIDKVTTYILYVRQLKQRNNDDWIALLRWMKQLRGTK